MTPREFLQRYPDAEWNDMNLKDMACRHCGNRESFVIEHAENRLVYDDLTEDYGDHDFDMNSFCSCHQCGEAGAVRDFVIEGLDELILLRDRYELPPAPQPAADLPAPSTEASHF